MPQHLGTKHKLIGKAAELETAALIALQNASADEIADRAEDLRVARAAKELARSMPEDEFACAWHRSKKEDGTFHSRARVVFEVTAVIVHDGEGEALRDERFREQPRYFVACPECEDSLKIVDHLFE